MAAALLPDLLWDLVDRSCRFLHAARGNHVRAAALGASAIAPHYGVFSVSIRRVFCSASDGVRWTAPSRPLRGEETPDASRTERYSRSAAHRDRIMR